MPRELIAPAAREVAFREYDEVPLQAGQVRVKSEFGAAKHGTEMALYKGYASPRGVFDGEYQVYRPERPGVSYPVRLGNMCVGTVIEVGPGVTRLNVGDRVFAHGAFRETHVWPETVRLLPDGVSWKAAVCLDPADFALGAVRDGQVRVGDAVAVFGLGAIGLIALQLAKLSGAYPVIGVDPIALRRTVATACGADLVLDPTTCDAGLKIKQMTDKRGADVCIDYSGSHAALQSALRGVAFGGTVVAGAWPGAYPAGLDLGAEAHFNRPNVIFSRACSDPNRDHPRWNEGRIFEVVWRLLSDGQITCEQIVQPVVAFDDLLTEYPKIDTNPEQNIKLGVRF
jgi:threonine dehydrogenase-like Zn-dependent dehydrogenase